MVSWCKWCQKGECWSHGTAPHPAQQRMKGTNPQPQDSFAGSWKGAGGYKGASFNPDADGWGGGSWGKGSLQQPQQPQQQSQTTYFDASPVPTAPVSSAAGPPSGPPSGGWLFQPQLLKPQDRATQMSDHGAHNGRVGTNGRESGGPGNVIEIGDLSGEWQIQDDKGNSFEYIFVHKAGYTFFEGSQRGGKKVAGQVKGTMIGWQVHDVRCKGELTSDGMRISSGSFWNKEDGQLLGTFLGEKIRERFVFALSGTWQITDGKGNQFEYKFEHSSGEKSFKGSQAGGKDVVGSVTGHIIEWEVNGVCCKGELTNDGARITNGTYWIKDDGTHLGTFVGENLGEAEATCPSGHPLEDCRCSKDISCKECRKDIRRESTFHACKRCRWHVCQTCLPKFVGKSRGDQVTCPSKHPLEECKCGKDLDCMGCRKTIRKESTFHACKRCKWHICQRCLQSVSEKKANEKKALSGVTCAAKHPLEDCKSSKDLDCKECRKCIRKESTFHACKLCRWHICQGCFQKRQGDQSKWTCSSCQTSNYPTWSECFGCKKPKPSPGPGTSTSANTKKRSRSKSGDRKDGKKSKKRSPSCSIERVIKAITKAEMKSENLEIEKGKAEALQEVQRIKSGESKEARRAQFKALLVRWHPDKNLDRQDVATAVFQFLSKGKRALMESPA